MGIEWREGLASRCSGTVHRSTAGHAARRETGLCEKTLQSEPLRKPEEEICPAIRRTKTDRDEARGVFWKRRVVSCGSGDLWWRTEQDLGSRESLYDHHRGSALGAEPKITGVLGAWGVLLSVLCPVEQLKAKRQESGAPPVSQEAEVSDAYEAVRKQVQQEAT